MDYLKKKKKSLIDKEMLWFSHLNCHLTYTWIFDSHISNVSVYNPESKHGLQGAWMKIDIVVCMVSGIVSWAYWIVKKPDSMSRFDLYVLIFKVNTYFSKLIFIVPLKMISSYINLSLGCSTFHTTFFSGFSQLVSILSFDIMRTAILIAFSHIVLDV